MKIERKNAPPVIIGKRVTVHQIIGGIITLCAFIWDALMPDNQLDAGVAVGLTTALAGIAQIYVVNRYGVTTQQG